MWLGCLTGQGRLLLSGSVVLPSLEADVHLTKPACHIQSPLHGEWTTSVTTAGISKWIGHTIRRLHSYSWFKFGDLIPTGSDCRAHQKVLSFKGRDLYAITQAPACMSNIGPGQKLIIQGGNWRLNLHASNAPNISKRWLWFLFQYFYINHLV